MANEEPETKKTSQKQADDDLFKALCLGTLRDDTRRIEGSPRNPRWKRAKKKAQGKSNEQQNLL